MKLGVGEDRITIRGVAHDEPVASGKSSKARKKNRRVEFEIVMDEVADPTEALASLVPEEAAEEPVTADETPDETAEEEVVEEEAVSGDEEAIDEDGVKKRLSLKKPWGKSNQRVRLPKTLRQKKR